MEKLFEFATRNKVMFDFQGRISVSDLWDLSLESLNLLYQKYNAELKMQKEESLLEVKSDKTNLNEVRVELIKHIVKVKLQEKEDRKIAAEQKERKQKILEIMERKQNQALENLPLDELAKLLND